MRQDVRGAQLSTHPWRHRPHGFEPHQALRADAMPVVATGAAGRHKIVGTGAAAAAKHGPMDQEAET
jgi:hypothetical protein